MKPVVLHATEGRRMTTIDPAIVEVLERAHFDAKGCGTIGTNACSSCFGGTPLTAYEVATVLEPFIVARVEAERERIAAVLQAEYDRVKTTFQPNGGPLSAEHAIFLGFDAARSVVEAATHD